MVFDKSPGSGHEQQLCSAFQVPAASGPGRSGICVRGTKLLQCQELLVVVYVQVEPVRLQAQRVVAQHLSEGTAVLHGLGVCDGLPHALLLHLVGVKEDHQRDSPIGDLRHYGHSVPLRSKDTQVAILHQQRGVVNSEDALMAETEESCPAIVAVAPQVSLTIRIPVCDDARCPVSNAIFDKELLNRLVHSRRQSGFVLARLVAFPSDVAALVILQVVGPRGEVTGARVVGLPVRVVEDLLIDDWIIREFPLDLHIPPPGSDIRRRLVRHGGPIGRANATRIATHVLGEVLVHTPRPRDFLRLLLPPLGHEALGTAQRFGDRRLLHALLAEVDAAESVLVLLVALRGVLGEDALGGEVGLVKVRDLFFAPELHPLVGS
mmetsp:Transcript_120693/g.286729  ORF Transcript_120693/g.286729 Transcript_120693/m.286729 type:complete len:378 (+) Transcript_120693:774-1907(+)